jgi:SAM-dependent methyltransferase
MDPTERFSDRVENYIKYRPGYPVAVVETLKANAGLHPGSRVADIGSGTGILTALLLDVGCAVYGVEPNRRMREAAERALGGHPSFTSVDGRAEATSLPDACVELVAAGQAFHWFDQTACRTEFARIMCPGAQVALIWNERLVDASPFLREYENLLFDCALDYRQVDHRNADDAAMTRFFGGPGPAKREFANRQSFDYAGLEGRLLSSSYVPDERHPNHRQMLAELARIFERHARAGVVIFEYRTVLYFGALA